MKELEENITPSSIGGMGAVLLPTATQDGSGDIPAGRGDATKEYKKKKKKMKKLLTFESFVNEANQPHKEIEKAIKGMKGVSMDIKGDTIIVSNKAGDEFTYSMNDADDVADFIATIEESVVNEAKFDKKKLMKAMKHDDGIIQLANGDEFIIYNPDNGNDENTAMWNDKVIFALDKDGEEHEVKYSDIVSYNESVVNEAVSKATKIYQIASPAPKKMLVEELENLFGDDYRHIVTEFDDNEGYESVIVFNLSKSDIKKIEDNIGDVLIWEYSIKKGKEITESVVNEAFSRMSKDTIENELYKASQELSKYYDWLKAGNDSGKGETLNSIIDLLKKCKSSIKRFNKPEEVEGTAFESVANELVNESFSSFLFNSPNEFGEFMNSAPDKGETKYLVFAHNKVNFNGQEIKLSGGYGIGSATSKSILGIFDNEQSAKDAYKAAMKKPEGNFVSFTMGTLLALTKFRSQYTEIEGHLAKIKIK